MINFNQLRVFYQAARDQNFTLAAKRLFITQPAVTAQIKFLEEYCNLTLFKKRGRHVFLTEEGRTLYRYAKRIFDYEKEIDDAIEEMRDLSKGTLRLGTTKAYARYLMPFLITRFHKAHTGVKINLAEGSSRHITYSLVNLINELAVIARAEDHPDVCFTPFCHEKILPILPPDHPIIPERIVPLERLATESLIMREDGSGTRRLVNDLYTRHTLSPEILMETSNTEFIKELVARGEGISFLGYRSVAAELQAKKLGTVELEGEHVFLDINIAFLRNQPLSPAAQAFLIMLQKITKEKPCSMELEFVITEEEPEQ